MWVFVWYYTNLSTHDTAMLLFCLGLLIHSRLVYNYLFYPCFLPSFFVSTQNERYIFVVVVVDHT